MKITNQHSLPEPLYRALLQESTGSETTFKLTPGHLALTKLLMPAQIAFLLARHDKKIKEDCSDRFWLLLGIAMHGVLESAHQYNTLIEIPMQIEIDGWNIYMRADVWESAGILSDYKITSVWSYIFGKPADYEEQLNCLRFGAHQMGVNVTKLKAIMMFRDWQKSKAFPKYGRKDDDSYPKIPFGIMEVKIWDHNDTFQFLTDRVQLFKKCVDLPDEALPHCTAEERWEKPTQYAVMKKGAKKSTKNFEVLEDAQNKVIQRGPNYSVETRPGESTRCEEYCSAKPFCSQYKSITVTTAQAML